MSFGKELIITEGYSASSFVHAPSRYKENGIHVSCVD